MIQKLDPLALPPWVPPDAWIDAKDTWTKEKKEKYKKNIKRQTEEPRLGNFKGSFKMMVKNGEIY